MVLQTYQVSRIEAADGSVVYRYRSHGMDATCGTLPELADALRRRRDSRPSPHVDVILDFRADREVRWPAGDNPPERRGPLTLKEQDELWRLLRMQDAKL